MKSPSASPPTSNPGERGAALLTVLLLVAVMAVIAAVMLDRLNLATRLASNGQASAQARLYALSSEQLVMDRVQAMLALDQSRTVDPEKMLGRSWPLPVGRGLAVVKVEDAGNCFNLNSVVQGQPGKQRFNPIGHGQLRDLLQSLQVPANEAVIFSDALVDWLDSDDEPMPNGAEDSYYLGLPYAHRTAAGLLVEPSELRALRGMSPQIFERLRPWVCALPSTDLSPININTLRADQARLLAMLAPAAISLDRARSGIAGRSPVGFSSTSEMISAIAPGSAAMPLEAQSQLQLRSRWFQASVVVRIDNVEVHEQFLIDAQLAPPRIVHRSWGEAL